MVVRLELEAMRRTLQTERTAEDERRKQSTHDVTSLEREQLRATTVNVMVAAMIFQSSPDKHERT